MQAQDHPRLRGEHVTVSFNILFAQGSPPPTRGTPQLAIVSLVDCGITPAYAGNTKRLHSLTVARGDHPRLRGEHANQNGQTKTTLGSPPPTRGTRTL